MNNRERIRKKVAHHLYCIDELREELKEEDVGIISLQCNVFDEGDSIGPCGDWVHIGGGGAFRIDSTIHASFSEEPHVALPGKLIVSGKCIESHGRSGIIKVDIPEVFGGITFAEWAFLNAEPGDTITITRRDG